MRDASFAEAETIIKAYAVMGGMEITCPRTRTWRSASSA
jgi:hypothetical protein